METQATTKQYSVLHEEGQITDRINKNYDSYKSEPQERHPIDHPRAALRGQLIDTSAQLFEKRMNAELQNYRDLSRFAGSVVTVAEDVPPTAN